MEFDRNFERAVRAGDSASRRGGSAMDAAKAMIEAGFDDTAACINFKARVAALLALEAEDPAIKARYAARAERLRGKSLDASIAIVEDFYKAERKTLQTASLFGRPARLPLIILGELRLMLRLFRRKGLAEQFGMLVDEVRDRSTGDRGQRSQAIGQEQLDSREPVESVI